MAAGELPELKHVVVMDAGAFSGAESLAKLMEAPGQSRRGMRRSTRWCSR